MYPHHFGGFPAVPFGGRQGPPCGNRMRMRGGMPFAGGFPPGCGQPRQHPLDDMLRRQDPDFFTRRGRRMSMPGGMQRPQQPFAGRPWMDDVGESVRNFDPSKAARSPGRNLNPKNAAQPQDHNFSPMRLPPFPRFGVNPIPAARQVGPFPREEAPRVRFNREAPVLGEPHARHKALQRYEKIKSLKTGGMSVAINLLRGRSDGKLYIEKRIKVEGMHGKRAVAELNALKTVRGHPNLNQLIESKTLDGGFCSIVLEFCDRGSLQDLMESAMKVQEQFAEAGIWNVLLGVSRALAFLHDGIKAGSSEPAPGWKAIAHLDLKPGNILVSTRGGEYGERRIVLADFGCAVCVEDLQAGRETGRRQPCGTPQWYPPEGLHGRGYGTKTDLYMLGATIHAVCHLRPIPSSTLPNYESPCGNRYSPDLNHVVKRLTQVEWRERPAARKVAPVALDGLKRSLDYQRRS